ncbi:MAG: type II toxin-antitoxin system RelE/ParE family toxin [Herpetosiphonaceae bacterium]|nr:type II toxin-antitoxin system RelE/ParE family toxin [Herpetosiphonaceae bacterium]
MKDLDWVGSSRDDVSQFPDVAKKKIGYALRAAQQGLKPDDAKPLRGFGNAQVLQITANVRTDTYRTVYTVQFSDVIYVLHAFQKKSTRGIATPKVELDLLNQRLQEAQVLHRRRGGK